MDEDFLHRQRSCRRRTLTPTSLPCYVKGARGRRDLPRRGNFTVPAGDNSAEGIFGTVKNSMRRLQATGKKTSDKMRAVQTQCAAALTRHSGMSAVLAAHKTFRRNGLQGKIRIGPRDAYNVEKCSWLWQDDI